MKLLTSLLCAVLLALPAVRAADTAAADPLASILLPGHDWEPAQTGLKGADGIAVNPRGEVFFCDTGNEKTYRVGTDGAVTPVLAASNHITGQAFGPDGRLYAVVGNNSTVVSFANGGYGPMTVIAAGFRGNDLAVAHSGAVYVTNPPPRGSKEPSRIWMIHPGQPAQVVASGDILYSNGITLSPDQAYLYVDDSFSPWVYRFAVQADGTLTDKKAFLRLREPAGGKPSGADGMHADSAGRLYITSAVGIQVCDPSGQVLGVIPFPTHHGVSVNLGGPKFDTLYAGCGSTLYRRPVQVVGANGWDTPQPRAQ